MKTVPIVMLVELDPRHWRYHRDMTMQPVVAADRAGLDPAAALFRSLGDPVRLAIVRRLGSGPARVTDLAGELGLAQSTVSRHLACLRDCALVSVRVQGRASVHSLAQPALPALLAAAEDLLAATGNAVALCPAYGQPR
jgi:DNA-binding transcriptional ArsR family regulator